MSQAVIGLSRFRWVTKPIPTVTVEQWRTYAEDARTQLLPLIIRELFLAQSRSWSPKRLVERWPDRIVTVAIDLPSHSVPYREQSTHYYREMTLAHFVEALDGGRTGYLAQVPLTEFTSLQEELDLKELGSSRIYAVNLWLGNNTRSGLHYDNADNLFGQIYGRKSALLISPKYSRFLYPFSDNPSKSQVDPDSPDFKRHPRCAGAEVWSCDLQPGDGLYIPRGWWHHIIAEDLSFSINCWHGDSLSELERARMFLAGGVRVVWQAANDFLFHGLMGHPYRERLFSPPPPGVQAYKRLKSYWS
jgi:Uncharacterized conserved protein